VDAHRYRHLRNDVVYAVDLTLIDDRTVPTNNKCWRISCDIHHLRAIASLKQQV
jgi:hypothetical protein